MKKSTFFAGLLMVSALLIGCTSDHSPETSTTKLWPAATVNKNSLTGVETEKWGYIDEKGGFQIQSSYQDAYDFSCGYALVRISDNSIFFIDTKNNMQSAPSFESVGTYFYYDHVRYMTSSGLWGLLDKNFEIVIQPAYYALGNMSDVGLIAAKQSADSKYGFLDKNGEQVIPAQFDGAYTFDGGYAVVMMGSSYGVIDKSGSFTINLQDKPLMNLGGGIIGFADPNSEKYGMMDAKGNIISQAIYDDWDTYGFTDNNLMAVAIDDKWGYIDKSGKQVISLQFDDAIGFIDGKAWIRRAEGANYETIDENGKTLLTLGKDEYPDAWHLGLCYVGKYNTTTYKYENKYINEKGATVYTWSVDGYNRYLAPKANKNNKLDKDALMASTKYGYRGVKF